MGLAAPQIGVPLRVFVIDLSVGKKLGDLVTVINPEWVTRAILSHADYSGVRRESPLEHTLYACDEMSGFVTAAALVRPSKSVMDLEAPSVIKKMKDKAFARAVNRDDLRRGAEELGLPLDEHVTNVIRFLREQAGPLGLAGSPPSELPAS